MSEGIFLTDDYQGFLSKISTFEKRIQQIISKTCDAVETINTDYDLLETESQAETDWADNGFEFALDIVTVGLSKTIREQVDAHKKTDAINSEIKEKIKDIKGAFRPLYKYLPNMDGTCGILATFAGVLDGVYNADASQAENISHILDNYGLISGLTPTYATTNLTSIRDNTKKTELSVREHDSYGIMSLKQAFLGDFSEDQTTFGAGMGLILQFIPFVDTACDIRDVAGDAKNIYEYENSNDKSWGKAGEVYGFTTLDIIGFIPIVGVVKYADEISDGVKAFDKINDTRKTIDKVNDARKSLSKIDDIKDAAKGAAKSTEAVTDAGKAAGKVSDVGKAADAGKAAEKASDAGKVADAGKASDDIPTAFKQKEFASTYDQRIKRTPTGDANSPMEWRGGNRGESLCVPKDPNSELSKVLKESGVEGIEYRNGVPDFSPVSKGEVKIDYMMGGENSFLKNKARTSVEDYYGNFAQADHAFADQLNSSPELAKKLGISPSDGSSFTRTDISAYRRNSGLTWHELNDGETMQLVPTIVNKEFNHLGGVGEINAGLFNFIK